MPTALAGQLRHRFEELGASDVGVLAEIQTLSTSFDGEPEVFGWFADWFAAAYMA